MNRGIALTAQLDRREVGLIQLAGDALIVAVERRVFASSGNDSAGRGGVTTTTPTAVRIEREPEVRPGEPGSMLPAQARELAALLLHAATAAEALDAAGGDL